MSGFLERLFAPVSNASLVVFRLAFGLAMYVDLLRYIRSGWVEENFSSATLHFTYAGFGWVQPLPGEWMRAFFYAEAGLAACIALGLFYRAAMPLFAAGFAYIFLIDKANYLNHFYLITLLGLLMCFVPCHRAASLDVKRDPRIASDFAPAWTLWMLRLQLAIVYVYGGVAKLNSDWLHGQPMGLWLAEHAQLPVVGPLLAEHWVALGFSWGGMLLDLLIVPALLWRRTRVAALVAALAFHLTNHFLFVIGVFPWLMMAATLLFLPPDWPHRLGRLWPEAGGAPCATRGAGRRGLVVGLLCAHFAVQVLLPLRHFLAPGNTSWTQAGARFAWRMKLNQRDGRLEIRYRADGAPEPVRVPLLSHLTEQQAEQLLVYPDMVLDFARHLARELEEQGHRDVAVHADALVSLNGREPRPLYDPSVDLSALPCAAPGPWLLPLEP